jgi:uncharacterized membrane protein
MLPPPGTIGNTAGKTTVKPAWPHYVIVVLTLGVAIASAFTPPEATGNLDALMLLLATAGSITALARQLPLQSVLFASVITAFIGCITHGLSARTAIPLGPLSFGESIGPKLFNTVPWTIGLFWIIAIFNSRGVARLVLRPWRKIKNYGFWLIGLTAGFALVFDLALEPFAHLKHFWLWLPTKIPVNWYGASPVSFLAWTFVVLIILAVIMPYLIRKQPGNHSAADLTPLALWGGAIILFGVAAARTGQWPALMLDSAAILIVGILSWRGAKW